MDKSNSIHGGLPVSIQTRLRLPRAERIARRRGHSDSYGASHVAARYCGMSAAPCSPLGSWSHGWSPKHMQFHPDMITVEVGEPLTAGHWVARKDEEEYLRSHGYTNVKAIGLPIVYVPPPELERIPRSLLVMPVHSLDYTTHKWKFDEYADEIASIRNRFETVCICVHPSCWKHGYWVDAFKNRGFELIEGAAIDDYNALYRVLRLLSSFEYVTTNGFGSQLAYAAYAGAKASIYGPFAEYERDSFVNDPFYRANPELLDPALRSVSRKVVEGEFPELFCHPIEAAERVEWGRYQLGYSHKVSPRELRALFGWTLKARIGGSVRRRVESAKGALDKLWTASRPTSSSL